MNEEPAQANKIDPAKTKKVMQDGLGILKKAGIGAVGLLRKLKKDRSPAAMIAAIDSQLEASTEKKATAEKDVAGLHAKIVEKKKALTTASKARKDILQEELKSLLSRYNAAKRTYKILLENERNMSLVKGRLEEVSAYGATPVSEALMDDVINSIEDAVDEAEAISDAARDLEKAGRRRERESDTDDLMDALAAFDEEEDLDTSTTEPDDFEAPTPARKAPAGKSTNLQSEPEE